MLKDKICFRYIISAKKIDVNILLFEQIINAKLADLGTEHNSKACIYIRSFQKKFKQLLQPWRIKKKITNFLQFEKNLCIKIK